MSNLTSKVRTLLETDKAFRDEFIEEEAASDIASAIIEMRRRRGLTQNQLAEMTGMKQSAISRLESASYSKWSFATIVRIAQALCSRIDFQLEPIEEVYTRRTEVHTQRFWKETDLSSWADFVKRTPVFIEQSVDALEGLTHRSADLEPRLAGHLASQRSHRRTQTSRRSASKAWEQTEIA